MMRLGEILWACFMIAVVFAVLRPVKHAKP